MLIYYGMPRPYSVNQEIYVDFLPSASYVTPGVWEIILTPEKIVDGRFDLWLPGQASLSEGTGFLTPTEERTLTIPSTASKVISVGGVPYGFLIPMHPFPAGDLLQKMQARGNRIWRRPAYASHPARREAVIPSEAVLLWRRPLSRAARRC